MQPRTPGAGLEHLKLRASDLLKRLGAPTDRRHGPFHAIEPARVRGRSTPRQGYRPAHSCRGLPGPHRHQRIHISFPRPPFEHVLPGTCAGYPALSCTSVVSRTRFTLYSVVSPSLSLKGWLPTSPGQEVPDLDMNYCDPHRHSLSTIPTSTRPTLASAHDNSCCRFPRVDAPEHVGYQGRTSSGTNHGSTPMAVGISATHARVVRLEP
jgi:hypothetical protein